MNFGHEVVIQLINKVNFVNSIACKSTKSATPLPPTIFFNKLDSKEKDVLQ
jgi:hypothetical protein